MKSDAAKLAAQLRKQGFDQTYVDPDGDVRLVCSQCQATGINGTACHEHGCPNKKN